jgi:arylformamidase
LETVPTETSDSRATSRIVIFRDGLMTMLWLSGAHLAAMMAARPDVSGALLISGLYELEPVRLTRLNGIIGMDRESAWRNSPILHLPKQAGPVYFAVGDDELPEMTRQTRDYYAAWTARGFTGTLLTVPEANHFTVMDSLADPAGRLTTAILELCGA